MEFTVIDPVHFMVGEEAAINKIEAQDLIRGGRDILPLQKELPDDPMQSDAPGHGPGSLLHEKLLFGYPLCNASSKDRWKWLEALQYGHEC